MKKQIALEIEIILREINPKRQCGCSDIEINPYVSIIETLNYRISDKLLNKFKIQYSAISGVSLSALIDSGFDFKMLLSDLKAIKENYFKEIG